MTFFNASRASVSTAAALCLLLLIPLPVLAYIGPGAGISFFGSIIGVLVTIVVAVGAILLWPIRRMMKRRKAAKAGAAGDAPEANP